MTAIICKSLTKAFKKTTVLDSITLTVEEHTANSVVAPDGSGKTTLIKVLTGLLKPTSGSCTLFNSDVSKDPAKALEGVGCLVGEPALYRNLTVEKNIRLFADLLKADADTVMEAAAITFGSTKVAHLSPSKKKQVGIAVALLGDPRLLILDEPLSNLDGSTKAEMTALLQAQECTLFFTARSSADAAALDAFVLTLENGTITKGEPQEVKQ